MSTPASHPTSSPIGVLALQGSFPLHTRALNRLGATTRLVRKVEHLNGLAALVLPGGESTVMSNLASAYGLFDALRAAAERGLPMMGTCAGAIFLGLGDDPPRLGVAPLNFERNAYGRQVDSFTRDVESQLFEPPFHGIFVRAPRITLADDGVPTGVEVVGTAGDDPVLVQCGSLLLATFHPELTDDLRVHAYFLSLCSSDSTPIC